MIVFIKLVFFIILSFSTLAVTYISGTASYKMKKSESLSFTKSYLHYLSYRNVITQELEKLGLDAQTFWVKYDSSFDISFEEHEQRYQQALNETQSENEKLKILATKKEFRLAKQKNFAGISHIIISDAIKNFGSQLGSPSTKTMRIDAKVNYKALRRLYSRFMIDTLVTKSFQEVVLKPKFDWGNVDFSKLGGMEKKQIEQSITSGWKEWFIKNTNIQQPVVVYLENEVTPQSNVHTGINRAILYINFIAREGLGSTSYPIHYQASLALQDSKTQNFVFLKDISNIKKFYQSQVDEGRRMANDIFSLPIPYLTAVRTLLEKSILTNHAQTVMVRNYKNIDDVLKIQDKLKTLGISFNLVASLQDFGSSNASLNVRHNGTNEQLKSVLTKVQNIFFPVEFFMPGFVDKKSDPSHQVL